ncbi:hypothetical protein [Streptomyces sp. NPDC001530]|uniref:hypothetical protein n=1 Tax=Streptomyces sp. NPDC001530 TaxID=3364582 RepID=UPI0036C43ED6
MNRNPVMRTLAAALLAGGVLVGVGAAASPASAAATTDGVVSLSHSSQANGGCRFGVGFNRGFNPYCGFGYGYPFGSAGYYPFSSVPVVVIVS